MYPPREMPKDLGLPCKKRHHPDELHLNTSLPKRLLSISEAELGSADGSPHDPVISPGITLHSSHGSIWSSSSSALITSDCSTCVRPDHSSMSVNAASSKLEGPGFTHSHIPYDMAGYHLGASKSTRDLPLEKGKGVWCYRSNSSKRTGIESDAEFSEVTFEKHAYTLSFSDKPGVSSSHKPDGVSGFGKATHVISRRGASSLNSKLEKDEPWHNRDYGYQEHAPRLKQLESSSATLYGVRERGDNTYSMAYETGSSCATGDSCMEEIRSNHEFSDVSRSVCKEASMVPPDNQTRAGVMVGANVKERSGCADDIIIQSHPSLEVVSQSSVIHKAPSGGLGPSYVLSSGRLSLEEEAKLGRRAPTIDRDFEEYFSSLML